MFIRINENKAFHSNNNGNIILIFTEGTILMHKNILNIYNFKTIYQLKIVSKRLKVGMSKVLKLNIYHQEERKMKLCI